MSSNLLSNKRERTKDQKEITLTLEKSGQNYIYITDTFSERERERSKIKIPLTEDPKKSQQEKSQKNQIKLHEKNFQEIKNNQNQGNLPIHPHEKKTENEQKPKIVVIPDKEIPLLQKYKEKNSKQNLIIPSCAQWFNFDCIHDIETRSLPEFFCGVFPLKTPEIYKEYRNYVIDLYRENSNSYLSSSGN